MQMDLNKFEGKEFSDLLSSIMQNDTTKLNYLATLKATRVEGMIIEHEAESAFFKPLAGKGWRHFPFTVLFCGSNSPSGYHNWFTIVVTPDESQELLKVVADKLKATGFPVRMLQLNSERLAAYRHDIKGKPLDTPTRLRFLPPRPTDSEVLNLKRVNSVFWGYAVHNESLVERFISDTILKDGFVSEGLNPKDEKKRPRVFVSDVDSILVSPGGQVVIVEVKHKQPTFDDKIGLNATPAKMAAALVNAGMSYVYLVLQKPVKKDVSTMYLYFDRQKRERAYWLARVLIAEDLMGILKKAPARTTLGGHNDVGYVSIPKDKFSSIGRNYDSADELQNSFLKLLQGTVEATQ